MCMCLFAIILVFYFLFLYSTLAITKVEFKRALEKYIELNCFKLFLLVGLYWYCMVTHKQWVHLNQLACSGH